MRSSENRSVRFYRLFGKKRDFQRKIRRRIYWALAGLGLAGAATHFALKPFEYVHRPPVVQEEIVAESDSAKRRPLVVEHHSQNVEKRPMIILGYDVEYKADSASTLSNYEKFSKYLRDTLLPNANFFNASLVYSRKYFFELIDSLGGPTKYREHIFQSIESLLESNQGKGFYNLFENLESEFGFNIVSKGDSVSYNLFKEPKDSVMKVLLKNLSNPSKKDSAIKEIITSSLYDHALKTRLNKRYQHYFSQMETLIDNKPDSSAYQRDLIDAHLELVNMLKAFLKKNIHGTLGKWNSLPQGYRDFFHNILMANDIILNHLDLTNFIKKQLEKGVSVEIEGHAHPSPSFHFPFRFLSEKSNKLLSEAYPEPAKTIRPSELRSDIDNSIEKPDAVFKAFEINGEKHMAVAVLVAGVPEIRVYRLGEEPEI